jgi:hypothetical protein
MTDAPSDYLRWIEAKKAEEKAVIEESLKKQEELKRLR